MFKAIGMCVITLLLITNVSYGQKLYVFVPSDMRAKILQDKIKGVCGSIDVTVFGRVKDFTKRMESDPPAAILALSPVIERNSEFKRLLQGSRKSKQVEPYYLVATGKEFDTAALGTAKLGVLDILGRKDMKKYISKLLNAKVKLKRVTKVEDLLPLLTFNAVDAIFVSETVYDLIKAKTEMDLKAKKLDVSVGLVSTAMASSSDAKAISKCVNAFPGDINTAMGVDQWKSL